MLFYCGLCLLGQKRRILSQEIVSCSTDHQSRKNLKGKRRVFQKRKCFILILLSCSPKYENIPIAKQTGYILHQYIELYSTINHSHYFKACNEIHRNVGSANIPRTKPNSRPNELFVWTHTHTLGKQLRLLCVPHSKELQKPAITSYWQWQWAGLW